MEDFLATQNLNMMPLATFNNRFVLFCNERDDDASVLFWVGPGFRRIKLFLESCGYAIGLYRKQSTIMATRDTEILWLEQSPQATIVKQKPSNTTLEQRAQLWSYNDG